MGIADWHMYLPLYQGFGDYWLAQGDLPQARRMATKLCETAALPPERTYLAFGHRLLAEIAIAERQWEQAEVEVARAMSAMNGPPTPSAVWHAYGIAPPECASPSAALALPLAAWRIHATAAKLCELQGRRSEAEGFRQQSRAVIQLLADSLEASDPLRESLVAGSEQVIKSIARE
jgi:hypothetical protein